jgi:LacI family transcriptional regulator
MVARRILFVAEHGSYTREVWSGLCLHLRERAGWLVETAGAWLGAVARTKLDQFDGDGVIYAGARSEGNDWSAAAACELPLVYVQARGREVPTPSVLIDECAVGALAAAHLADKGLRRFAYYGQAGEYYSLKRWEGFRDTLVAMGLDEPVYHAPETPGETTVAAAGDWLASLDKPVGVFGSFSGWAMQLLHAARERGIAVPEQAAVIGGGDVEMLCEAMAPPLTSVDLGGRRVGYQAARLLDAMIDGAEAPAEPILLPPVGVVQRQSTELLAVDDELVIQAAAIIQRRVGEGLVVDELLDELAVSRRTLENRCSTALGATPGAMIRKARMDLAERLLAQTDLSLAEVAKRSGFTRQNRLSVAFRRELGMTPSAYREQMRSGMTPGG